MDTYQMSVETAQAMLDEIDTRGHGVTDWEASFLDDLLKQTDDGHPPTTRQTSVILKIHADRVVS